MPLDGELGAVAVGCVVEPALLLLEVVDWGNLVGHRDGEAIGIQIGALVAPRCLEGMTAVEGVDAGGAPVAEDPSCRARLEHCLAVPEGQLVDIVG